MHTCTRKYREAATASRLPPHSPLARHFIVVPLEVVGYKAKSSGFSRMKATDRGAVPLVVFLCAVHLVADGSEVSKLPSAIDVSCNSCLFTWSIFDATIKGHQHDQNSPWW
jgi:hypothetical protein